MRDGPVAKYYSSDILQTNLTELERMGYEIIDVSLSKWTRENAHKKIQEAFGFPDYYGENIAAFEDCLNDLFNNKRPGLVVVFRHFDNFYKKEKDFSEGILDSICNQSWGWLLAGKKLLTMIQSDDPHLEIPKIGGFSPRWNGGGWLNVNRSK